MNMVIASLNSALPAQKNTKGSIRTIITIGRRLFLMKWSGFLTKLTYIYVAG
jgi:hypothetical protein